MQQNLGHRNCCFTKEQYNANSLLWVRAPLQRAIAAEQLKHNEQKEKEQQGG